MNDEEILKATRVVTTALQTLATAQQWANEAERTHRRAQGELESAQYCANEAKRLLMELLSKAAKAGSGSQEPELLTVESAVGGIVLPQGWSSNFPAPKAHIVGG